VPDGFTLAAVGDLITTHPLAQTLPADPDFAAVVKVLRDADAAYGNFETTAVDLGRFTGQSYPGRDDWPVAAPPSVVRDLRALGFDLVSRANNHAMDYGIEGMRETSRCSTRPELSMPESVRTAARPGLPATSTGPPRASASFPWPRPIGTTPMRCRRRAAPPAAPASMRCARRRRTS
jgi:hypothetical protein